jgi:hypothetical protein
MLCLATLFPKVGRIGRLGLVAVLLFGMYDMVGRHSYVNPFPVVSIPQNSELVPLRPESASDSGLLLELPFYIPGRDLGESNAAYYYHSAIHRRPVVNIWNDTGSSMPLIVALGDAVNKPTESTIFKLNQGGVKYIVLNRETPWTNSVPPPWTAFSPYLKSKLLTKVFEDPKKIILRFINTPSLTREKSGEILFSGN